VLVSYLVLINLYKFMPALKSIPVVVVKKNINQTTNCPLLFLSV